MKEKRITLTEKAEKLPQNLSLTTLLELVTEIARKIDPIVVTTNVGDIEENEKPKKKKK